MPRLEIHPDVRRARTPPAALYRDPAWYAEMRERIFARTWHYVGPAAGLEAPGSRRPVTLLPGCLDEPLLLVRGEDGRLRALSNVCTHRGALLVEEAGCGRALRCPYHGRRFGLDGRLQGAPGFEGALDFPRPEDDLPQAALAEWAGMLFAALDPEVPFERAMGPALERLDWLPWSAFEHAPGAARDYAIDGSWALYCDNYLEGLHVPFVHRRLNATLDMAAYEVQLFEGGTLQLGIASGDAPRFDLPAGHPDAGRPVHAWYFWLFPGLMLNVYPWGLSLNAVQPTGPERARVCFRCFVWRPELFDGGAQTHETELEDEQVVALVRRGIGARLYQRGRYAPEAEAGVHHFHRMLAARLG